MIFQFEDLINWFLGAGALVMVLVVLILFLLILLLPVFLLKWGIKIAKGENRNFGPVFITYLLTAIVSYAVTFIIGLVPAIPYGNIIGSVISLLLGALIVSKRHDCSFGGGLIALIVPGIILGIIIVLVALVLIFGFGMVLPSL